MEEFRLSRYKGILLGIDAIVAGPLFQGDKLTTCRKTPFVNGSKEFLDRLNMVGYKTALITSFTDDTLRNYGINFSNRFDYVFAGNGSNSKTDILLEACEEMHKKPSEVAICGVYPEGAEAAMEVGIDFWAVRDERFAHNRERLMKLAKGEIINFENIKMI